MKRKLYPYLSSLTVVVALLAGIWLAVPRDICLTKLLLSDGCVCTVVVTDMAGCNCCNSDSSSSDSSSHESGCFSISSHDARFAGPERTHSVMEIANAVAVLPLSLLLAEDIAVSSIPATVQDDSWRSHDNKTYRDNCVFLI